MWYNNPINKTQMTSKTQLQSKIQELEAELQSFKQQLNTYKPLTIQEANVGDHLDDGSIVLHKENGLALVVAPKSTEVLSPWSSTFPKVYEKLQEHGFTPSQWFVPTKEQLLLAYLTLRREFSTTYYWSSTETSATFGCIVSFTNGSTDCYNKALARCVRAFRCVTY